MMASGSHFAKPVFVALRVRGETILAAQQSFQGTAIVRLNPLQILQADSVLASYLDMTVEELLDLSLDDLARLIDPDDLPRLLDRGGRIIRGEAPLSSPLLIRVLTNRGHSRSLELFGRRIDYEGRDAVRVIFIDVTERVQAQRLLESERDRAMLYMDLMSHNVRNLLQVILGCANVLEHCAKDEEAKDMIEQILECVRRCEFLIAKVRATETLATTQLEPCDAMPVLNRCLSKVENLDPNLQICVATEVNNAVVHADAFIELLMVNILENALTHNSNKEKRLWVSVTRDDGGYLFSFSDNGRGLSDSAKKTLFDLSRRYGGVSLHQCRQIVDKYGGKISVKDRINGKPHEGANFLVWLPEYSAFRTSNV